MNKALRVLVVDDSPSVRELLAYILGSDQDIARVATAADGREALEIVTCDPPDVVTMDIQMPGEDGFETTRRIMETRPTPIVIVTGSMVRNEVSTAFRALDAGALAVLSKPVGPGHPEFEARARELVQTVKVISEVKLVRRWPKRSQAIPASAGETRPGLAPRELDVVAVGASTGGPVALQSLLSGLPKPFPLPVLIVQHIAQGFTEGFVEWLAQTSGFPVRLARHDEFLETGHAYVAPEDLHMAVTRVGRIALDAGPPENGLRPAASRLFRSVADIHGPRAVGILLTGMGKDGAAALKQMKDCGAVTFAQDAASSVVHGMPGEAIALGAADYVLPPEKIAAALASLTSQPRATAGPAAGQ